MSRSIAQKPTAQGSTSPGRRLGHGSIAGLRSLSETLAQVTRPLIGDRRVPLADLRAAWREIVGRQLAGQCQPHRLAMPPRRQTDGTLQLRVASGAVALELQHQAPLVIERINGCLGYPAVARLKLVHAPLSSPSPPSDAGLRAGLGDGAAAAAVPLDGIADPRLRASLARLARRLAGGDSPPPAPQDPASACPDPTGSL